MRRIVERRAVSRQWFGKHIPAAMDTHASIQVLLEKVFYTWSVQGVMRKTVEARIVQLEKIRRSEKT
jgi:hypothetical protein